MSSLIFSLLFLVAFLERVVFDLGPNVELVTLVMLFSSFYLGRREALGLVLAVMVVSDLFLGNTNILVFTWSGFLIPAFLLPWMVKKLGGMNKILLGTGMGFLANLFFYGWTNLGVWVLDGWGMYADDLGGLIQCYINGLPFLRGTFLGDLGYSLALFGGYEAACRFFRRRPSKSLIPNP